MGHVARGSDKPRSESYGFGSPAARSALSIPECRLIERGSGKLELECADVKGALLRLVSALQDYPGRLEALEIEESNLERVFLSLTGRALRD